MATKRPATPVVTLTVTADGLGAALEACSKTVQNSRNAAVYKCVMLMVGPKRMVVRGTDLAIYVERHLHVDSDGVGEWLVPFGEFYHFIKNVSGKLTVQFNRNEVQVRDTRRHSASVKLRDPREFTSWPKWEELKLLKVDAEELLEACRRSTTSVSDQYVDPTLLNVSLKPFKNGHTDVQASNNHRYQLYRLDMHLRGGILIPLAAADIIAGLSDAKHVALHEDKMIGVETDTGRIFCVLSDGDERYPNFAQMLPHSFVTTIVIDKEEMSQTMRLAKGFADSKYHRASLSVDPIKKLLKVESSVRTGGFASVIKLAKCTGRKPISLLMDVGDLEQFMALCQGDKFLMRFTAGNGQILFADPEQPKFWFVAHPLMVGASEEEEEKEAVPAPEK